jgi:hypothetical protein
MPSPSLLPARAAPLLVPLLLSVVMTCVVSAVATLRALGFSAEAASRWPEAWGLSWLIAFPTLLVALPLVRRVVGALTLPR